MVTLKEVNSAGSGVGFIFLFPVILQALEVAYGQHTLACALPGCNTEATLIYYTRSGSVFVMSGLKTGHCDSAQSPG